eukprot:CAMPEP_0184305116 /NCGR_PEP_ID=MMETSP1049-20130417/14478_1 /TAXON_ID=77928 /ORGANISM="Proteomonas sulcata, Strain CCMP704" /LENGTH=290 /DNA_ID=CAMNT_0026617113 /DNA_START=64 /DNA_END=933 /DNA_ORIENTATION=+
MEECWDTWMGYVSECRKEFGILHRGSRLERRTVANIQYAVMLEWFKLAHSPDNKKATKKAMDHDVLRTKLAAFYDWLAYQEHRIWKALTSMKRSFGGWARLVEWEAKRREYSASAMIWVTNRTLVLRTLLAWASRGPRGALLKLGRKWTIRAFDRWKKCTFKGRVSLADALRSIDNVIGRTSNAQVVRAGNVLPLSVVQSPSMRSDRSNRAASLRAASPHSVSFSPTPHSINYSPGLDHRSLEVKVHIRDARASEFMTAQIRKRCTPTEVSTIPTLNSLFSSSRNQEIAS